MKFNKTSTVASCLVLFLSAALMTGCKPIFEKKPLPPKDGVAAPAASAPAAAPAPASAEPAEIEDVQSLESLDSTEAAADEASDEVSDEASAAIEPVVDDGDDVVKPTPAIMRKIQQALVDAGFNPGPVDGVSGARTVAAIEGFQKQNDIPAGKIDKRTLRALGVEF